MTPAAALVGPPDTLPVSELAVWVASGPGASRAGGWREAEPLTGTGPWPLSGRCGDFVPQRPGVPTPASHPPCVSSAPISL